MNGIVRVVRLFTINSETNEIIENICQSLITERIADHCEESYMSKVNRNHEPLFSYSS